MRILSIETSCDETAVAIVEAVGEFPYATYTVLGNGLLSQIDIHREFGGVFPNVAKREHAKALIPMLQKACTEASLSGAPMEISKEQEVSLRELLEREPELADLLIAHARTHGFPQFDMIAITNGPGLEPALWVGVNFARALTFLTGTPVVAVNHMEGHILSSIFKDGKLAETHFPVIALLISGGHTDLILMRDFVTYEKIGGTRDDAVGEAFDKVARMLGLPYPGGPEISTLATQARESNLPPLLPHLPRPMILTDDLDMSFSGLKTAVRTRVLNQELTEEEKKQYAREFENAVTDVLLAKTRHAVETTGAKTVVLGGGVTANVYIRDMFTEICAREYPEITLALPDRSLSTDNAIMIALSGHAQFTAGKIIKDPTNLRAEGNKSLEL